MMNMKIFPIRVLFLCALFLAAPHVTYAEEDQPEQGMTMAMTAAFVSEEGLGIYEKIAEYLQKKTGEDMNFLTGLSYSTVNEMTEEGAVSIAFVCGYPYVLSHDGKENPPIELLAAPVMESPLYEGKPVYYSYIIVKNDSPLQSFEELKGKRWAYNDKISNSGYNMPRAKLIEIGETNGFFGEIMQSGSHEESIRWVSEGKADASAVDSLVLDYALATGEDYAKGVKIIEKLGPAGIPPVVRSAHLSDEKAEEIKSILLHMHEDPEGKEILKQALVKQFVAVDDSLFDGVRKMHQMAVDANFMEIK